MDGQQLPEHAAVERELVTLQLGVDASELHGALAGFVCGGGEPTQAGWLQQLQLEAGRGAIEPNALDRLFLATLQQLDDDDCGFELLLPDDGLGISERAQALVQWVRGFLGGFGLAAGEAPPLSDEAREALQDLAAIASSDLSCDDADSDEESFSEIGEFVRVVALLLHGDCHGRRPASQRIH